MRQVLATSDLSLAISLRLSLEAAHIEHSTNFAEGADPMHAPLQVLVVDQDYDRARQVLSSLQATSIAGSGKRFSIVVTALFAILVVASLVVFVLNALHG
jgi:hypothetical protein